MNPHIANKSDAVRIAAQAKTLEAEQEKVRSLERRVKRLEQTIRTFLSAGTLTESQRVELVELLAGLRPPGKATADAKFAGITQITQAELRLIDHYRKMSTNGMQTLSKLADQLARLAHLEAKKGGR